MILLALCLIQASADNYYYRILLNSNVRWSEYIEVSTEKKYDGHQQEYYVYHNGLRDLIDGKAVKAVKDENHVIEYSLPKKDNGDVDLDGIKGIMFANGKGIKNNNQSNILEGDEYEAWKKIRTHIKILSLRDYKCNTYTNDSYFMYMDNVEVLELPKDGMTVGDGDDDCIRYFANAWRLKEITIWNDKYDAVDITKDAVKDKKLLNRVGKFMFSNCYSLSTKYINRLIKDVSEIKNNAFSVDKDNRYKFSDGPDNEMAIKIPDKVTKIGNQAFCYRAKVTGLNIQRNGDLEIGSEAFRGCEQLNALNLGKAMITYLGTGVFGDCRSMTNEFVNGVLQNYADHGGTKIPAYLFYGCNGQDGHDGSDTNKYVCSFTHLDIPAQFSEIGDGAFASSGDAKIKLETITVNRDKAPKCLDNSGETVGICRS